jgi:hypothetical protein
VLSELAHVALLKSVVLDRAVQCFKNVLGCVPIAVQPSIFPVIFVDKELENTAGKKSGEYSRVHLHNGKGRKRCG